MKKGDFWSGILTCLTFAFLLTRSIHAAPEWNDDKTFLPLKAELAEIRGALQLAASYPELAKDNPDASTILSSIRSIIRSQLFSGSRPLRLATTVTKENEKQLQSLPSIYANSVTVDHLPALNRTAFVARRSAYIDLAKKTQSISELEMVSIIALHQMGAISDEVAFDAMLGQLTTVLSVKAPQVQFTLPTNTRSELDAATLITQLAVRLDRRGAIEKITRAAPNDDYQARTLRERLINLAVIYSKEDPNTFVKASSNLVLNHKVSFVDILSAIEFNKRPYSIACRVLIEALGSEKPVYIRSETIQQLLLAMPDDQQALEQKLITLYIRDEQVSQRERTSLAAYLIMDAKHLAKYKMLEIDLLDVLLTSDSKSSSQVSLLHLKHAAVILGQRLGPKADDDKLIGVSQKLVEQFLKTPGYQGSSHDENFAYQLLKIVKQTKQPELYEKVFGKLSKSVTWPFHLVFWCLKNDQTSAAFSVLENGNPDSLFPLTLKPDAVKDGDLMVPMAEKFLAGKKDQQSTLLALLLVESFMRTSPKGEPLERAMSLQKKVIERWGSVEHTNEAFLQQGNRVILRNRSVDKNAAVPAMRLWMNKHPVSQILPQVENPIRHSNAKFERHSNAKFEVWRSCLNSGYFKEEVAYLADALTEAGIAGDAARHRAITEALVRVVSTGNSSSQRHPEPLSGSYSYVKTRLLSLCDPHLQKQPAAWAGILVELERLELSKVESSKVFSGILSKLADTNYSKLSPLQKIGLYIKMIELELPKEFSEGIFAHQLSIPMWSPLDLGTPEEAYRTINSLLKNQPNRVFWASYLFSSEMGNHFIHQGEPVDREKLKTLHQQWVSDFQIVVKNTWMEGCVAEYVKRTDNPRSMILYSLFDPESRRHLRKLPLGFLHQTILDHDLVNWLSAYPKECKSVIRVAAEIISEAVNNIPAKELKIFHSKYGGIGRVDQAILSRYKEDSEFYRAIYSKLRKSLDKADSDSSISGDPKNTAALDHLRNLLLQIELMDGELKVREPQNISPSLALISYLKIGEIDKAVTLMSKPGLELRFIYPPRVPKQNTGAQKTTEEQGRLYQQAVAQVVARIPESMADRKMFLRILTNPNELSIRGATVFSPMDLKIRSLDPRMIKLLSDFDKYKFKDKDLAARCMHQICRQYGAGKYLPLQLRSWKNERLDYSKPKTRISISAELIAWVTFVISRGDSEEFKKLMLYLYKSNPAHRIRGDLRLSRVSAVIRMALVEALNEAKDGDAGHIFLMAEEFLAQKGQGRFPRLQTEQNLLQGSLLGHLYASSKNTPDIAKMEKEFTEPRQGIAHSGWHLLSPIDYVIFSASVSSQTSDTDTKKQLFNRIMKIQSKCQAQYASLTPYTTALSVGLLDREQSLQECRKALEANSDDLQPQLDYACLLSEIGEKENAIARLKTISASPGSSVDRNESRLMFFAKNKLRILGE